jgi:hypothetical protein
MPIEHLPIVGSIKDTNEDKKTKQAHSTIGVRVIIRLRTREGANKNDYDCS